MTSLAGDLGAKDNELFNFNNYLKLERIKWKVEINLGSWIVKHLHLKQMKWIETCWIVMECMNRFFHELYLIILYKIK